MSKQWKIAAALAVVLLIGVALFTAASFACALAPSLDWLIAARFVQALGVFIDTLLICSATAFMILLSGVATVSLMTLAALYRPLVMECVDPGFLRSVSRWSPVSHYGFLALLVINLVAGFQALGTLMSVGLIQKQLSVTSRCSRAAGRL